LTNPWAQQATANDHALLTDDFAEALVALGRLVKRRWTPEQGDHAGHEQVRPELIAEVLGASL